MSNTPESNRYKVILLGDAGVGKTSIAKRQTQGSFDFKMNPTVGAAHLKSTLNVDGRDIELMIWDTAGQEQFASLVPMYSRNAHVCILVGSIVNTDSIQHLTLWRERLYSSGEKPPIIVAINKVDLVDGAPMTTDDVRLQCGKEFPNIYFVSARTGDSIDELFTAVATEAMKSKDTKPPEAQAKTTDSEGCSC